MKHLLPKPPWDSLFAIYGTFLLFFLFQHQARFWHLFLPHEFFLFTFFLLQCFVLAIAHGEESLLESPAKLLARRILLILLYTFSILSLRFLPLQDLVPFIFFQMLLSAWLLGPDFWAVKKFFQLSQVERATEAHSWFEVIPFLLVAILPFFLHPYLGWLGASLGLLFFWSAGESYRYGVIFFSFGWKKTLILPAILLILWGRFIYPFPSYLYNYEVLYAMKIGEEVVTVNARRHDDKIYYTLTLPKSIIYQTTEAYRYAELMVHPAWNFLKKTPRKILVIGGEKAHILRELAKYRQQHSFVVTWIDLFPDESRFFRQAPIFKRLNALTFKKLELIHLIAPSSFSWLDEMSFFSSQENQEKFDLIIADLPLVQDFRSALLKPNFTKKLTALLSENGIMSIHLASPYTQTGLYWCLIATLARERFHVIPYQLSPALFQDYGFALVSRHPIDGVELPFEIPVKTKYLYKKQLFSHFRHFSKETSFQKGNLASNCLLLEKNRLRRGAF